jgi:acetyl esterase/lipase
MRFSIRHLLGTALGISSAVMGTLIAIPTLHERTWIPQGFLSEFPWTTTIAGLAGAVASIARKPRSSWGVVAGTAGVALSLLPLLSIKQATKEMEEAMIEGLGNNYLDYVPELMREKLIKGRWSPANTLKLDYDFPDVTVTNDVVYSQPGLRPLMFDIYQPKIRPIVGSTYPAIITIHGGGWRAYDKGGVFVPHHSTLARQGYVVFDMQYRFSGEAKWPAQLQDVQCAIRWIKAHAAQYNIDPKRIVLLGRSAGGHMALLAAYRPNDKRIPTTCEEDGDSSVAGVIALYPPTDLRLWRSIPGTALTELIGDVTQKMPEAYADASPIEFVRDGLPPTLLIQGNMDELVSPVHTELLYNKLRGTNSQAVLLRIPWSRHVFDALMSGMGAQLVQYYIERFLAWCVYRTVTKRMTQEFAGIPWS